jgi:PAS domain S-box-containing protein
MGLPGEGNHNESPSETVIALHVANDCRFHRLAATFLEREADRLEIAIATSATDALDRLEAESIDCVVSDYQLPDMDGLEFLAAVRDRYPTLPFVLFTSEGSENVASEAISAGATDYLRREIGTDQYAILANRILQAVGAARHARERQRQLEALETAREGISIIDEQGRFVYVNDAFAEVIGEAPEGLVGAEWTQFYPEDDAAFLRNEVVPGLNESGTWQGETRGLRADGTTFVADATIAEIRDGGFVCTVRDITDRKRRERVLTALHDVAADLNTASTVDRVCERTIEASEALLAFDISVISIEEDGYLPPRAISEETPADGQAKMSVDEGLTGKTYRSGESFLIDDLENHDEANPQGPYRSAISIPVGDHGVFQAVAAGRGAFEREDLELAELLISHAASALDRLDRERELRRHNDRLEEFASFVSHDLRNPLTVAEGELERAREDVDSTHLVEVARAHERMEALIDDLLTIAREGDEATDVGPVDLEGTVVDCWQNVATNEATLRVESDATIVADERRLQQLLENLVRNAVEHGGSNVTVTVGDLENGFFLEDDGAGIPSEDRDRVFETGFSTSETGSGLGLTIVSEVVEAHDWTIDLGESDLGGARFEITGVEFADS